MLTDKLAAALCAGALLAAPLAARAEGGDAQLLHAGNDVRNKASLQRGARNFMNYCSGCHSAQYVRYNRIAADLDIAEPELKSNLMFTSERSSDTIRSAMPPGDASAWFGNAPPDLSLIARSRSPDYVYSFLKGFYLDPARPHGVNNVVLPGTAMPHVLADLQGTQRAVFVTPGGAGAGLPVFEKFELLAAGRLGPEKYDEFVRDTVNFLDYIAEPIQVERRDLGVWVMLFLLAFTAIAYLLKREYWRDVR
jgi:ubiquinol-cytochrome c reductase cytochrome c1 subunit